MEYAGFAIGIKMKLPAPCPAPEQECLARAVAAVPKALRNGLLLHCGPDPAAEDAFLAVLSHRDIKRMRKVAAALRTDPLLAPCLACAEPFIQNNRLARYPTLPCYGVLDER